MSPRTGRPKSENPRNHQISTRMNDAEFERLNSFCQRKQRERADTVREAVIEFLDRREKE